MITSKEEILQLIESKGPSIQALGAQRLGLFGSFARGEQKETSDIDLLVEFRPGMKTFNNLFDMAELLETLLQKRVDLLTWEGMAGFVQSEVKKDIEYVSFGDRFSSTYPEVAYFFDGKFIWFDIRAVCR